MSDEPTEPTELTPDPVEPQREGKTGKRSKPRLAPVLEFPRGSKPSDKHRAEQLHASGLSDPTIELAELYTEHHPATLAQLAGRKTWPRMCGNALVFPFFVPGKTDPIGYRLRPTNPRVIGQKRDGSPKYAKYEQAWGTPVLVYFPPRARKEDWYREPGRTVYWTEGEKKALLLDQLGLCTVGLTGVWNYADVEHKDETGERLHVHIREHVAIAGQHHVIVYDADARTNEQVMNAAGRLCGVLLAAGAASVRFVCPPTLEKKGIDDYYVAFGEALVRQLLDSAAPIEPLSPKEPLPKLRSHRALFKAPIDPDLRLPAGYTIEPDGALWKIGDEKHGDQKVARGGIFVCNYLDDYYTQEGRVEVCFERDGRWVTATVNRKAIVDSRTMVAELSVYGAPCTSNNAGKLVDFIDDLEQVNVGKVPRLACVGRAGWHNIDGHRVFVLDEPITLDTERNLVLALDNRGDRKKLFNVLKKTGDLEAHRRVLARAWCADPICAAMIAGALAAPLLEPLGAPNFAVHLTGDSSRGKTSMLKVAASVYADPNSDGWVANWNTTQVGAELRAAVFTDLPQPYDEVGVSDPQQTERTVYMLINGGGKVRGRETMQLRETPSWRTIVLSTGERELASEGAATGAQIRVIHFAITKFGVLGAAEIDEIREQCAANAGSFGRAWIEALLEIDDWTPFRAQYKEYVKLLRAQSIDPLRNRLAGYFAVLCVAESLASQLGLGDAQASTLRRLYVEPGQREEVDNLAERSRGLVFDWVMSEPDAFPELEPNSAGVLDHKRAHNARVLHGFRRDDTVLFIPRELRTFLEDHRLSARTVLRSWAENGWLQHEPGRHDKSVRLGSNAGNPRFNILSRPSLEAAQ